MRASTKKQRRQLLSELENNPLIERACKKVGIARSTFYRWCESDPEFKKAADSAIGVGREKMNDYVESKLLESINAGNFQSIRYWLDNNSGLYGSRNAYEMKRMRAMESTINKIIDSVKYKNEKAALLHIAELVELERKRKAEEGW